MEIVSQILSVLAALLLLSIFVMVHEYGHYKVGKLLGFGVVEFAIGMGPKIWGREKNGTLYAVRAFPIGGMCRFYGEDEEIRDGKSFNAQKMWKRFLVILAGPVMNLIFAVVFAVIALTAYGDYAAAVDKIPDTSSPAYAAGMRPGDVVHAINGEPVRYDNVVSKIIAVKENDAVITVERNGEQLDLKVENIYDAEAGRNLLGVNLAPIRVPYTFLQALGGSFGYVGSIIQDMLGFLRGMFTTGVQLNDVAGPVGTIGIIGTAVRVGVEVVLRLSVMLSVNLAVINLLPLPALDGGRLVFIALESIRRKPVPEKVEGMIHFVGIILLFGLIILLTFNDIKRMIGG
ncbi:MAG TPA: M50 family metallopeptidase [Feifaniaceae bacterium]|nr:M50 family metallopeptidase [Feifaniaceae bacterium]